MIESGSFSSDQSGAILIELKRLLRHFVGAKLLIILLPHNWILICSLRLPLRYIEQLGLFIGQAWRRSLSLCVCVVCKCGVRVEWLLTDALGVSVYVAKCLKHVTALKCLCVCVAILFMLRIARFRWPFSICDICVSVRVCGMRHFMHRCVALAVNHNCLTNCFWTRLTCWQQHQLSYLPHHFHTFPPLATPSLPPHTSPARSPFHW